MGLNFKSTGPRDIELYSNQRRAVVELYEALRDDPACIPLACLPTGAGKSLVAAHIARDIITKKQKRVVCLVPLKKLVEQNLEEFLDYSGMTGSAVCAGLNRRELDGDYIVGTVHSLHRWAKDLGAVACVICDEAHLVKGTDQGMWRKFLKEIQALNPDCRIIGLTATPGRLDQGLLTEGDNALFTAMAHETRLLELINSNPPRLCRPVGKAPEAQMDTSRLHTRMGEYVAQEVEEEAMRITEEVCDEVIAYAGKDRKIWMHFCSGIQHAELVAQCFSDKGYPTVALHSKQSPKEQDENLRAYMSGKVMGLAGCEILTTGFNHPPIDLVNFFRATKSPALFVQATGRGLRTHPGKEDCLVLDFGGNFERFGPLDMIADWGKPTKTDGKKPAKICKACREVVPVHVKACPACGTPFPVKPRKSKIRRRAGSDVMLSDELPSRHVKSFYIDRHFSERSGNESLKIELTVDGVGRVNDFLSFEHEKSFPRHKAKERWLSYCGRMPPPATVAEAYERRGELYMPSHVTLKRDGKYWNVA